MVSTFAGITVTSYFDFVDLSIEIEGLPHGKPSIPGTSQGRHRALRVPPFHQNFAPPSAAQKGPAELP